MKDLTLEDLNCLIKNVGTYSVGLLAPEGHQVVAVYYHGPQARHFNYHEAHRIVAHLEALPEIMDNLKKVLDFFNGEEMATESVMKQLDRLTDIYEQLNPPKS